MIIFFLISKCYADPCIILDFETAWARVLSFSPALGVADAEVCLREAEKKQVSLFVNPIATVEVDNVGISHPNEDTEPPVSTYSLSQLIELGGKRRARRDLATSLTTVAYWDAQIVRQDLRLALTIAFIDVKTAQEQLKIALSKRFLVEKMLSVVRAEVAGGKASAVEEKRAQIDLIEADLAVKEASYALNQTKKKLAIMWGSVCPDFDDVSFDLEDALKLDCETTFLEKYVQNPEYMKAQLLALSARKNLKLQKINSIPDVTVLAGYRVFHDSNQRAWVLGASMPIPFFDRNQGNIKKAFCEIDRAEHEFQEVSRFIKERIAIVVEILASACEEIQLIRNGILCHATEALELTELEHQNGKVDYLELLESEKILLEVRKKYIDILYKFQLNRAELARLNGEI